MSEWNAMTYEGKDTILRVVRDEAERLFALAEQPGDLGRGRPPCDGWSTRDIVGAHRRHDRGLLPRLRRGPRRRRGPGAARAAGDGASRPNEGATAFRGVPQAEMMERLRADFHKMQEILDADRARRLDRPDGHPRLHGPGAGLLLRRRPADGLRRPLVGHPAGQRPGARRCPATPPTCWCRSCSRSGGARCAPTQVTEPFTIGIRVSGPQRRGLPGVGRAARA